MSRISPYFKKYLLFLIKKCVDRFKLIFSRGEYLLCTSYKKTPPLLIDALNLSYNKFLASSVK